MSTCPSLPMAVENFAADYQNRFARFWGTPVEAHSYVTTHMECMTWSKFCFDGSEWTMQGYHATRRRRWSLNWFKDGTNPEHGQSLTILYGLPPRIRPARVSPAVLAGVRKIDFSACLPQDDKAFYLIRRPLVHATTCFVHDGPHLPGSCTGMCSRNREVRSLVSFQWMAKAAHGMPPGMFCSYYQPYYNPVPDRLRSALVTVG